MRWSQIGVSGGRVPAAALHAALPRPASPAARSGRLGVLSCDRAAHGPTPERSSRVLEAGRRAGETVVCDLPRYPTDAALAALGAADVTVVVVPADLRSCAAAARVAEILAETRDPAGVVVRGPSPGGVDADQVAALARAAAAHRDAARAAAGRAHSSAVPAPGPGARTARRERPARGVAGAARCHRRAALASERAGDPRSSTGSGPGSPTTGDGTSPATVAAAVRAEAGGVASDLDVLAALRVLRAGVRRRRPARRVAARSAHHRRARHGAGAVWVDRGTGLERTGDPLPRRRRRAPARPAAGARRGPPARRRQPVRRRLAGRRRGPAARRARRRSRPTAPACRCACCGPRRTTSPALRRMGTLDATGEALLRAVARGPARVRSSRAAPASGKTTHPRRAARRPSTRPSGSSGGGRRGAAPRHPHVVRLVSRPANIEGAGGVSAARPGAAGAADAARPAGRRGGPRRRGLRSAGRAEHRSRRRRRHGARQLGARGARPDGGARRARRDGRGRAAQPARRRRPGGAAHAPPAHRGARPRRRRRVRPRRRGGGRAARVDAHRGLDLRARGAGRLLAEREVAAPW